jgi:hypothetical protein
VIPITAVWRFFPQERLMATKIAPAETTGPIMTAIEQAERRDLTAHESNHGLDGWAGTPLITRAACMATFIIAVAEEKGILDAIRFFAM